MATEAVNKLTIFNLQGEGVIVTDLEAALQQAEEYVGISRDLQKRFKAGTLAENEIYFANAHHEWENTLKQLLDLKRKQEVNETKKIITN